MLRALQTRADDLAERLLVSELEMRRCRTLAQRMEAFHDFAELVDRIDSLRVDIEQIGVKKSLLHPLDLKVSSIMRAPAYRVLEWFHLYEDVRWYVDQPTPSLT